jgi:hypothetical protein
MFLMIAISPMPVTTSIVAQEFIVPVRNEGEITGRIERIDPDASVMTVRVFSDGELRSYTEENIYIKREALIEKDGEILGIEDLAPFQNVTVQYRVSLEGDKQAIHIWINEE